MAVVYQHRRKDTGEVFYIGKGVNKRRAFSNKGRNPYWHNIVNKFGYDVDILITGVTLEEAAEKEIELISTYGRKDLGLGTLVNMTDGGGGTVGYKFNNRPSSFKGKKHTEEANQKNREAHLGKEPANKGKPSPFAGISRPAHSERMKGSGNSNAKKILDVHQGKEYPYMKAYMLENNVTYKKLQELIKEQKLKVI